ncbi:hypothetical protein ACA910_011289 [Epithemia clementina (nom. ined.)]
MTRLSWFYCVFLCLFAVDQQLRQQQQHSGCYIWRVVEAIQWRTPFQKRNEYTPLLFFTVPPGLSPEVDAVEKAVRKVERQLNVRVERMDLLRKPENEAVLRSISRGMTAPYLYHRESMQVYYITPTTKKTDDDKNNSGEGTAATTSTRKGHPPVHVDMDRIRAWAKGRYLPPKVEQKIGGIKVFAPKLARGQDSAMENDEEEEEAEILEELTMTPLQRKGKQAMKERTEQLARRNTDMLEDD